MSAAEAMRSAVVAADASPVFADAGIDRHAARIAAAIDPAFLAEAGWNAAGLVLFPPPENPLLGRPVCRAEGCATTATGRARICASCRRRLAEHGLGEEEIAWLPARAQPTRGPDAETGMLTGIKARAEGKRSNVDGADAATPAVEPVATTT